MTLQDFIARTTQLAFARQLGVSQGLVSHWITERKQVAPEWVLRICEVSDWQVTPHEVRPDIYPNPSDGLPAQETV